jgi:hypothetical protein
MNEIKEASCYDCGMLYSSSRWIEAIVPDKVWNMIRPEGCGEGAGLLCVSCIVGRLNDLGIKQKVPVWICGTEPLKAMSGDPIDNLDILRNWTVE